MPRLKTPREYDPNPLDNNKEFRVYAYLTKEDYELFLKSKAVIRNQLVAINKIRPNENISQTEIFKSMMNFGVLRIMSIFSSLSIILFLSLRSEILRLTHFANILKLVLFSLCGILLKILNFHLGL